MCLLDPRDSDVIVCLATPTCAAVGACPAPASAVTEIAPAPAATEIAPAQIAAPEASCSSAPWELAAAQSTVAQTQQPSKKRARQQESDSPEQKKVKVSRFLPHTKNVISFTSEHVDFLNEHLATLTVPQVLDWCLMTLPNLIQVTSFGLPGMVVADMLRRANIRLPTVFIDTLHHFPETLAFAAKVKLDLDMDLRVYHCKKAGTRADFERIFRSTDMWISQPNRYDFLAKVEPLNRALEELNAMAWLTGRRASQNGREKVQILEYDPEANRLKVNPLAHWDYDMVWSYIREHNVPYNPLHDQGYKSIGDQPTTRKTKEGEDERGGRFFQHSGEKTECGIHLSLKTFQDALPQSPMEVAISQSVAAC